MYKYKLKLCFVTLLHLISGEKNIGDFCTVNGESGECKLFANCPLAGENLKNYGIWPKVCGFQKRHLVVCCPRLPGELSRQKCREYSKYVYKKFRSPVLLTGAPIITTYECEQELQEIVPLIIGGELAKPREFPHMASIGYKTDSGEISWDCGGTIISEKFILTAAHCFSDPRHGNATFVRVGVTKVKNSEHGQTIQIKEIIAHPDYKYPLRYNDIGLIKLEKPIKLNLDARPACLYTQKNMSTTKVIATGWGVTSLTEVSKSDDLRKVVLKLTTGNFCKNYYARLPNRKLPRGILEESQLCADGANSMDTCWGDSGGPLQIYHTGDDVRCMYDVVGITSFGKSCGLVGVYTRISNYIGWIEDQVWLS